MTANAWAASKRLALVLVIDVEEDCSEKHQSLDHLLEVDAETDDRHAVVHDAHDERADDGTGDLANAAGCRSTADEAGCDNVQLEADASLRRRRVQAGRDDHAGETGQN